MSNNGRGRGSGKRKRSSETGFEIWGGYMSAKVSKLENQFKDEAEGFDGNQGLFSGVAIFVNGYTNPTGEELKRIMLTHGGTYHHYYSRGRTTHIVASNLPNTKIQNMNTDFIVSPKWITDSLAKDKLLDYKNYLLYTNQSRSQPKLMFNSGKSGDPSKNSFNKSDSRLSSPTTSLNIETANWDKNSNLNAEENIVEINKSKQAEQENIQEIVPEIEKQGSSTLVRERTNASVPGISTELNSKRTTLSTVNPNFLTEFYNNSRLHHLSTTGAQFKQYVKDLQEKEDNFTGREYLKKWLKYRDLLHPRSELAKNSRTIMHIDMDCFFVSVGLISRPHLKNQPVVVTHATRTSQPRRDENDFKKELNHFKRRFQVDKNEGSEQFDSSNKIAANNSEIFEGSSKRPFIDEKCSMAEIASCSYEARKRGIKNGMFLGVALKLCPELKTIPYDFEGYQSASKDLYDIVASYTKNIEAVSCDEMYVDLGDILTECQASPLDFSTCIRQQIQEKTKCSCSVGIGPNMVTARMATKKAKPNGQFLLKLDEVQEFMRIQSVSDLPGVGGSLRGRLEEIGVITCGDLQKVFLSTLQSTFGDRTGRSLHDLSRGIDERPINREHQRKSVSAEINYGIRFESWQDAEKFLLELSEEVVNRMTKISVKGRTITLKLKVRAKDAPVETAKFMGHGICDNVAKSATLYNSTADKSLIYRESLSMLKQISVHPKDLRGVGIQVSKLEPSSATSVASIKDFFSNSNSAESKDIKNISIHKPIIEIDIENENNINDAKQADKYMDRWLKKADKPKEPVNASIGVPKNDKTIDIEVLNALPEDMREQVLEEYRALGYNIPISAGQDSTQLSPQPGPSNIGLFRDEKLEREIQEQIIEDVFVVSHKSDTHESLANLSYSQIDESFLNALPGDIKRDLRNDIQRLKTSKEISHMKSLNKVSSLSLTKQGKIKRGRPRGSQNKLLRAEPSKIQRSEMLLEGNGTSSGGYKQMKGGTATNVKNMQPSTSDEAPRCSAVRPNLCGENELESIKALISQWIYTCEAPADIDLSILTTFCTSLISGKDLEKLDLVLRFMRRKVQRGSLKWRKAFDCILESVQCKMIEHHEAPLGGFSDSIRHVSINFFDCDM